MFSGYQGDVRRLLKHITELVYYMRGSIPYDSMMQKSFVEREIIGDFIKKRLEIESKRPFPQF